MADVRARLRQLERAAKQWAAGRVARCPACGAGWPGSVYLSVGDGGGATPRCVRCDAERPHPGGRLKAYAAGLMAAL